MNKSHVVAMSTGVFKLKGTQTLKSGPSSKESLQIVVIPSEVKEGDSSQMGQSRKVSLKSVIFAKSYEAGRSE